MDDGIYSFLDHNSRNYRDDGSEIPTFGKSISFEESDYEMKTVSNYDEENADRIFDLDMYEHGREQHEPCAYHEERFDWFL